MSGRYIEIHGDGCVTQRSGVVSSKMKREFAMIDRNGIQYAVSETPIVREAREDGKVRKPKKFRAEWMEEEHLKDWLQPYPGDDTMCVCTACDIVLRCGKSELEKHATGLKHTNKVQEMKAVSCVGSDSTEGLAHNAQTVRIEQFLNKNDDPQVWIPVTPHPHLQMEEDPERVTNDEEAMRFVRSSQKEKASCDTKLTEALVKLFEFADGKVDLSRKRLEMLQEEHALRLQILEKELHLKTLEVEIKETELKKLKLEMMQNSVKESQLQHNTQLAINEHQLHVISDQQLQDALQVQLQQLQSHYDHQQGQESKGVNVSMTS